MFYNIAKEVIKLKAAEVLNILQITRPTLQKYREKGYIKASKLPNGHYDFDGDSVYRLKNRNAPRQTVIYGRVSTYKQKNDLKNQMETLTDFVNKRGYQIDYSYSDIASGISFKNRKEFFELLDMVIQGKVKRVVITHKDRLSRVGFDLFKHLFDKFGTEIIVMSDYLDPKTDEREIMSEIISLLHCFAMRQYSARRKLKAKAE